jgi:hypothetical protein
MPRRPPDFDEEIRIYEHLLGTWPDDDIALTNLSIAYNARSRFADAAPLLQRLVDLGYRDAISLWEVVNYQMLTGRVAAAESTITSMEPARAGHSRRAALGISCSMCIGVSTIAHWPRPTRSPGPRSPSGASKGT